jgi:hypothetical protein
MTEARFWDLIEWAWKDSPKLELRRADAVTTNDEDLLEDLVWPLQSEICENYIDRLSDLSKDELTAFIRIFEEKLYKIDRQEIHEYTDGSDDGFLYCRCFIVAMGQRYYEMVDADPSAAAFDLDAERFGFAAYDIYEEKFDEEFDRGRIHNIESGSNADGWPEI